MRGKLMPQAFATSLRRITPAHAGKTLLIYPALCPCPDHPRACGENTFAPADRVLKPGSPPRMRGKRSHFRLRFRPPRITPAHAGKTSISSLLLNPHSDHPRACGENFTPSTSPPWLPGSPPRMRGKPHRITFRASRNRITPAHAGKTPCARVEIGKSADHPRACGENWS